MQKPQNPNDYLCGRLEAVKITNHRGDSALGNIVRNGTPVIVNYGGRYVDEVILVRFDLLDPRAREIKKYSKTPQAALDKLLPIANFISRVVPPLLGKRIIEGGLSPQEFIFYALFPERGIPTLHDVNHYFEPGPMGHYAFLMGENGNGLEVMLVYNRGSVSQSLNGRRIVDLLPSPQNNSRVVLAATDEMVKKAKEEIEESRLAAICMEPFSH